MLQSCIFKKKKLINIPLSYLTPGSYLVTIVGEDVSVSCLSLPLMEGEGVFINPGLHRNLHAGRPAAAGLLPQAAAPRSARQPCHSDGRCGGGADPAAALSHGAAALIRNHCHPPAARSPTHPPSSTSSHLFVKKNVKKKKKEREGVFFFYCDRGPLVWENGNHINTPPTPHHPESSLTHSVKFCLSVCDCECV